MADCVLLFNFSRIFATVICGFNMDRSNSKLGIGNAKCGTGLFKRAVVLIWWWFNADH